MISLALIGGLAAAKRWGPAYGVVASALLYVAYGLWTPLGVAAIAALLAYARGIAADRLTVYALAAAFAKSLLVPYALGRPIPYYEALWYAAEVNPLWRTYAPSPTCPKSRRSSWRTRGRYTRQAPPPWPRGPSPRRWERGPCSGPSWPPSPSGSATSRCPYPSCGPPPTSPRGQSHTRPSWRPP